MKKIFFICIMIAFFFINKITLAQDVPKSKKNKTKGMGSQEDLDADFKKGHEEKMTKEDKKNLKKKKKEIAGKRKKDEITRKEADKRQKKQMKQDKRKVRAKKKRYVKTH